MPYDQTVFREVGVDDAFYNWIYGNCNNNSDNEGITSLIEFDYYEQSACITTFYDHHKNQYFKAGEAGFRYLL